MVFFIFENIFGKKISLQNLPTAKHNLLRLVLAFFCLEIFLHDSKRKMSAHRVAFENGQAHRNRSSIRKVMLKKRQGGSIIIAHSLH